MTRPRMEPKVLIERVALVIILTGVTAWLGYNLVVAPGQFATVAVQGLSNGALYALIALGYTLVYGIIELINFAHGDLFMLGALFSAWLLSQTLGQTNPGLVPFLWFLVTLLAAMVFCSSINVAIEFFAYRRLRTAPKLAPLITAVGVSFILQFIGLTWNGSGPKNWSTVLPEKDIQIGSATINTQALIVLGVTLPLLAVMSRIVTRTRAGKAMRATAQDQDAARLMGVNVNRTISFTFAMGGALAGAAGVMYQQTVGTTNYNLGFQLGLIAFTSAVLGGIGNLTGAVMGGLLIGLIQGLNDGLPYALGQKWSQSVVFSILILFMVFRPAGIFGSHAVEKV